ncbi:MAG TPA: class I adenylate-forming enzyme family protein [Syntrophomonas sp.]|nr:class I adenylate-forming enzyme family protein [Syntrophomonas sp.]
MNSKKEVSSSKRGNRLDGALPRLSDYMKRAAAQDPGRPAFIYHDVEVSYAEFSAKSQQLAKYLLKIGIEKGDRLAYIMNGRPEFFYLYMAASMVGAIIVGMGTRFTAHEMEYVLNNSEAKCILTLYGLGEIKNYQERLEQACQNSPSVQKIWVVGGAPEIPNALSFDEIMNGDYSEFDKALQEREAAVGTDDGLLIVYTSGTTGQPKGALMSHRNVVSEALIVCHEFGPPTGLTPDDRFLHHVPVNHVSGATEMGASPIVAGCTQVVLDQFHPVETLEQMQKHKVTIFCGVPTMFIMEFNLPNFDSYDLSAVRFCMIGGSMAPQEVLEKMLTITPYCSNPLGLTETSGLITYTDIGADADNLNKTVGKCAPEFQMKLVDINRAEVPRGTPGEIAYRGPTVIKEYFKMPEATSVAIDQEGWLYSGDVGIIDENGDLRLVGRSKEMYITGGENVYPAEVEEYISRYPGVAMVALLPVPHGIMGEVGRAYIVPKPGATLDGPAIEEYLKDYLAPYKIPRQYIFRDSLPMTALGKIEKKVIRQEIEKELQKAGCI